jgi:hypothetical protein
MRHLSKQLHARSRGTLQSRSEKSREYEDATGRLGHGLLWRSLGIPQPARAWLLIIEASEWKLFYKQTPPCLHPHRRVSCSSACCSWTIKTCTRLLATSLRLRIPRTTRPARLPISCNLSCRLFQISPILVPLTSQTLPRRRPKDRS